MGRTAAVTSAAVLEMERRVLVARRAGMRVDDIAVELGVSPGRVSQLFKAGMARHVEVPAAEIKQLEAERLDELQFGLWRRATSGDLKAVEQALAILERRAKLLGLDHSDKIAEQYLQLEQDKVKLMAMALNTALDSINITDEQRAQVFKVMDRELASATEEDTSILPEDPAVVPGEVVSGD